MNDSGRAGMVSLDGIEIAFEDVGPRDGQVILFLHGFPLSKLMWRGQLAAISESHRVVSIDMRGHGKSTVTSGTVTMAEMADDIARLLQYMEIGKAIVCGLSMGGYVAWEFWRRHRRKLSKLILCDTRAVADTVEVARGRQMMAAQVVVAGAEMAAELMVPKLMAANTYEQQPEIVELLRDMILATDPLGIAATQRGMAERFDMTPLLPEMDVPALILCGSEDTISPPEEMSQFAGDMPHAKFVEIERAGHLAPLEQPAATNDAIREFLVNTSRS